ncbi:MAG: DUF2007 domain-containing protein [Nitrospirae bacterium]|nr:DUF2007 domain-containing protein [Nitrospirota bacterium]
MSEWVELLFTYDEIEAQIVKRLLEGDGIQVVLRSMKVRPYPVSIGKMGEVKLMVREEELERAKEIIKAMGDLSSESVSE